MSSKDNIKDNNDAMSEQHQQSHELLTQRCRGTTKTKITAETLDWTVQLYVS